MTATTQHAIKRAQKESLFFQTIAQLFNKIMIDDKRLEGLFVNRVCLSSNVGVCTVYLYSMQGKDFFKERLDTLKLYKPSVRKALAVSLAQRHTPDLVFAFDEQFEKTQRVEELLEKISHESKTY